MSTTAWTIVAVLAGAAPGPAEPRDGGACRLVVLFVVDQLPADVLERFADLYTGGFRKLRDQGARFTNCHYQDAMTRTGPGHAAIITGAVARVHGVVGNHWMAQGAEGWRKAACVEDLQQHTVGADLPDQPCVSPRNLAAEALGDALKRAHPQARVLACSLKDRAAVLCGGRSADGAYWWHHGPRGSAFVTSDYYPGAPPAWLAAFNARRRPEALLDGQWTRLLDSSEYDRRCHRDDADYERGSEYGVGDSFPHPLRSAEPYEGLLLSPAGNDLLLEFALHASAALELGQRGVPDLLVVSLSSNDEVGHAYGPFSHEVMDITVRTDRQIGAFLDEIDRRVGLQQCLVALTSDHGVTMMPEHALAQGQRAGRIDGQGLRDRLEAMIARQAGPAPAGQRYVTASIMPWIYLDRQVLADRGVDGPRLRPIVESLVAAEAGIAAAYVEEDMRSPGFVRDELTQRVYLSWVEGRSGQIYVHLEPYWYFELGDTGHGTAHPYDTHVPLMLMGPGVRPGRSDARVAPTDLAPTLARLLGIDPPRHATGRVLEEALAKGAAALQAVPGGR